jgi:FKBP-type peptidyl-prolyl cis-trans isomerase
MKLKILVIMSVFVVLGGTIGYTLWHGRQHSSASATAVTGSDLSTKPSETSISTQQPSSALPTQGQALGASTGSAADTGSSLQTNIGNPSPSGSSSSAPSAGSSPASTSRTMPGPESLMQFDSYKDAKYTSGYFADLRVGTGAAAAANSKVSVVYKGWLTNGTLFDESKADAKGQPQVFSFALGAGQVIKGWDETVVGMKVGGQRMLIIPPAAGYGATGNGPVPPNSVMVFEVQLVAVQ